MRDAVVAIEDERFYEHSGVDFLAILRAAWANVTHREIVQGGSTITQQFIKNAFITDEQTVDRKLREAALAYQLEKQWSKEKILNEYLNIIYFGEGAYGIEAAALHVLRRARGRPHPSTRPRSSPGYPRPLPPTRPGATRKPRWRGRDLVLNKMYQQGYITQRRSCRRPSLPRSIWRTRDRRRGRAVPYWVEMVREQLVARYGSSTVLGGGLRVYTSVDLGSAASRPRTRSPRSSTSPGTPRRRWSPSTCAPAAWWPWSAARTSPSCSSTSPPRASGSPARPSSPSCWSPLSSRVSSPDATYDSGPFTIDLPGGPWDVSSYGQGAADPRPRPRLSRRTASTPA